MSKVLTVGHLEFSTQKAALEHFRRILNGTPLGQPLVDAADADVRALLARHPEADRKRAGADPVYFFVGGNEYGGRCFYLRRPEGTETDFSFMACIKGKPSKMAEFKAACRTAVVPDILAAKERLLQEQGLVCAVTGETLTLDQVHVDHAPPHPFDEIVQMFIREVRVDPETVDIPLGEDGDTVTRFGDRDVALTFRLFHDLCAHLRLVSKRANLSILRRAA